MKPFFRELWQHVFKSIIAAIVLSFVYFVFSDYLFHPPDLNGRWLVEVVTDNTRHDDYKNLICYFEVILRQDGTTLSGTAEQIGDIYQGQAEVYDYTNRVRVDLAGSISRNYLRRDVVSIHWVQHGQMRDSSTFFKITRFDDKYMFGKYESTIAYSAGRSEWVRRSDQFKMTGSDPELIKLITSKE